MKNVAFISLQYSVYWVGLKTKISCLIEQTKNVVTTVGTLFLEKKNNFLKLIFNLVRENLKKT